MEKDSDLPETATKGLGLRVCVRLPGKGSIIETTERNLLRSMIRVFCCYVQEKLWVTVSFVNWMTVASWQTLFIPHQRTNKGGPTKTLFSCNVADNWCMIGVLKRTCIAMNVDNYWPWTAIGNVTKWAAIFNRPVKLQAVFFLFFFFSTLFSAPFMTWCNLNGGRKCKQIAVVIATRCFGFLERKKITVDH